MRKKLVRAAALSVAAGGAVVAGLQIGASAAPAVGTYGWGNHTAGQAVPGGAVDIHRPALVGGLPAGIRQVSAGAGSATRSGPTAACGAGAPA